MAFKKLLAKTGTKIEDYDLIELNEAFASAACGVTQGHGAHRGADQRQRRRGRARAPDRRQRRARPHDAPLRHEEPRRQERASPVSASAAATRSPWPSSAKDESRQGDEMNSRRSASSAPARWAAGSPRSSRRRARPSSWRTSNAGAASTRASPASRRASGASSRRRRSTQADADAIVGRIEKAPEHRRVRRLRPRGRGDRRGPRRSRRRCSAKLDAVLPESAILATNTSSIWITELAAATSRPDRFIGMHFMNPVPLMKLVEVIRGLATSDETYERVKSGVRGAGQGARSGPTTTRASSPTAS